MGIRCSLREPFTPFSLPHIIQNNHWSVTVKTPVEAVACGIGRVLPYVFGYIGAYGLNGFVELLNSQVKNMADNIEYSPLVELRRIRQKRKILEILEDSKVSVDDAFLEVDVDGNFYIPNLFDSDGQYIDLTKLENYVTDEKWLEKQSYKALKNENRELLKELEFYKLFFENLCRRNGMQYSIDMKDALYDTVEYLGYKPSDFR